MIHGMCDDVMTRTMKKLELEPKQFVLKRLVKVGFADDKGRKVLKAQGVDSEGTPYSLFSRVDFKIGTKATTISKEPFVVI